MKKKNVLGSYTNFRFAPAAKSAVNRVKQCNTSQKGPAKIVALKFK